MTDHESVPEPPMLLDGREVLVTDEELCVLLGGAAQAVAVVFPDGAPRLPAAVVSAVRRTLVARGALSPSAGGDRLELVEPWTTLVVLLSGSGAVARVTTAGDGARAQVIVAGSDEVARLHRDPSGVNVVAFSGRGSAAEALLAPLLVARGSLEAPVVVPRGEPVLELEAEELEAGRAALADGDDEVARGVLGEAFEVMFAAGTSHRLELIDRSLPERHAGLEVEVLDAAELGWVLCVPSEEPGVVRLRRVDDATLAAFALAELGL